MSGRRCKTVFEKRKAMKILYLDYPAIGGETIKKTFKKLGHEVVCFEFPHDSAEVRNGEELGVRIAEAILQADADLVFSFNFYPVAATAVHACFFIPWRFSFRRITSFISILMRWKSCAAREWNMCGICPWRRMWMSMTV